MHEDGEVEVLEPAELGYHHVISCLGWRVNTSAFELGGIQLTRTVNQKYVQLNELFEADGISNLFMIGAAMHAKDFRVASGGFIHGFRYLIRSLHRYLEMREEGVPWPVMWVLFE